MINQSLTDKKNNDIRGKDERRESFRMPFIVPVLCCFNGSVCRGTMSNLSVTGFFMKAVESPPIGSECDIEIVINGEHSSLRIDKLKAIVVRSGDNGVGFQFEDLLEWIALVPVYSQKMEGLFSSN